MRIFTSPASSARNSSRLYSHLGLRQVGRICHIAAVGLAVFSLVFFPLHERDLIDPKLLGARNLPMDSCREESFLKIHQWRVGALHILRQLALRAVGAEPAQVVLANDLARVSAAALRACATY
jgi:hypothetical protein